MQGVIVARVEPMSPAFGTRTSSGNLVLLEINRHPGMRSIDEYRRLTADALLRRHPDALHLQSRSAVHATLHTVKID